MTGFHNCMTEISFTSKIVPIKTTDFLRYTASFPRDNFVDCPWNISTSRVARDVFTSNIADCTSCLITTGKKALLMHLYPTNEANHDISKIEKYITNNLDMKDELQAVLVGSQPEKESLDIFNKFKKMLNNLGIPTSIFQTGKSRTHLAYKTSTDELVISSNYIDSGIIQGKNNKDILFDAFEKVEISACDEI